MVTFAVADELAAWRAERPGLRIDLVRGNHDRAGPPPDGWGVWERELSAFPFALAHYPDRTHYFPADVTDD